MYAANLIKEATPRRQLKPDPRFEPINDNEWDDLIAAAINKGKEFATGTVRHPFATIAGGTAGSLYGGLAGLNHLVTGTKGAINFGTKGGTFEPLMDIVESVKKSPWKSKVNALLSETRKSPLAVPRAVQKTISNAANSSFPRSVAAFLRKGQKGRLGAFAAVLSGLLAAKGAQGLAENR